MGYNKTNKSSQKAQEHYKYKGPYTGEILSFFWMGSMLPLQPNNQSDTCGNY